MIVAGKIVQNAESQRIPEPLRPHGRMVVIVAAAVDQDSQPSQRGALYAAQSNIAVVSAVIDQDADAAHRGTLGHVLGLIHVVAAPKAQEHGDAQHRAALNTRLRAHKAVVAAQVDHDQDGAIQGAGALQVFVVATQVDHCRNAGHPVQVVDVLSLAADDDRPGGRGNLGDNSPRDAFDLHVAVLRQLGQLLEQFRTGERGQCVRGVEKARAVHFLQKVAPGGRCRDR